MNFLASLLAKRGGKLIAAALGTLLAGGITSIAFVQPAVEKASDYAAKAVELYCQLPAVDRVRFRTEITERLVARALEDGTATADFRVSCPLDSQE